MKRFILCTLLFALTWAPRSVFADEPQTQSDAQNSTPTTATPHNAPSGVIELDDEKMEIEADIPMVDLIISFRELQDKDNDNAKSFLEDVVESARHEPF